MNPIFTKMVDAVEAANAAPDDYINPTDGLKYCGKCHTPKEAFYPADLQAQGFTKHPVMCKCAAERRGHSEPLPIPAKLFLQTYTWQTLIPGRGLS